MLKLFKKKQVDPKQQLREVLGDAELPSFPAILVAALEKVRDPDSALNEIGDLVASDPGLTVNLLRTVNSPAFALRHKVRSIHHAISLLGRSQLESMLISMAVGQALPSQPTTGFDPTRFWSTAAKRAATARALADRIDPSSRSESFTASLLQDLAVPLLAARKGEEYGSILEQWHNGTEDLAELERQAFGWDHAAVGGAMCEEWSFPDQQAEAIAAHHDPLGEEPGPLPAVRIVASLREVEEQAGIDELVARLEGQYSIPADDSVELVRSSFENAEEIARLFA